MAKHIALAGAAPAGQISQAGLISVYQGFAVACWRSQTDSADQPTMSARQYRGFMNMTTGPVVVTLFAIIIPIVALPKL